MISHRRKRPSAEDRGYGADWRAFRDAYLKEFPFCVEPGGNERAVEVHQIKRVRTHRHLRLSRINVRGHRNSHHSAITATEDSFCRQSTPIVG